ncbi:GntR family transcriptional regulator [Erysipelotrichaceae bacterium Oil+RF-744-GAM-WT-6]|jgi:GntR family transcriptional regulator|uniref:GntR family transcriptional regulator n=1 Tax=Stecheria intestinalis TaxID=2606630 RepID=A0A7X2NT30_9FIRM|nr:MULTISPECIES: GntR family transcriptional regulator [Erysipelotrichaceae]MDY3234852.1 GntR family transcriptional regulator [Erysipelotrichaceae bacterium]MDY4682301.1 GntR family transcriptional regulator [Lachnospiraceae bacterium]MCI6746887.1 GntR family transcriptional regulator [Anaerolactibacter massiliensis]MDD5882129.1 GntR family transcriptional regulator [Stecheria intestinalis]MDD6365893.1 GntR family transcriptional regulator [Stecheria intestinalis]
MFLLNIQSKVPIFEQIETQIMRFIETGVLAPGDRLPSVRQMAIDNGINPNTVAKAYAKLEQDGYVNNIPKKGVYVAEVKQTRMIDDRVMAVMKQWREEGIAKETILTCADAAYGEKTDAEN